MTAGEAGDLASRGERVADAPGEAHGCGPHQAAAVRTAVERLLDTSHAGAAQGDETQGIRGTAVVELGTGEQPALGRAPEGGVCGALALGLEPAQTGAMHAAHRARASRQGGIASSHDQTLGREQSQLGLGRDDTGGRLEPAQPRRPELLRSRRGAESIAHGPPEQAPPNTAVGQGHSSSTPVGSSRLAAGASHPPRAAPTESSPGSVGSHNWLGFDPRWR